MTKHLLGAAVAVCAFSIGIISFSPAHALSMSECSAKYKAAKDAGTLGTMKWNDFRKAQCGAEASTPAASEPVANPLKPAAAAPAAAEPAASPAATAAIGNVVFPSALSPKFSTEAPGRQRLHTCSEQYQANKANGGNGGLKWIQKGGGYWSECNKHLKGSA
jgi:hypothetical protein